LLIEQIGRGGMSEVWRAEDELLGRPVAVKALAAPITHQAPSTATWQEARSAARLTHPHVTQVYDYGEATVAGGAPVPYLVLELVDGLSLADRLSHGRLPWRDATRVAAQVAAGLAAAHRLGVVHRDIKPGNVMLTETGAKVLDFGIAALAGARPDAEAGWLIGTPAYVAPERLRPGPADPAGDIYSLGALLYVSLTGRPPIPITTWGEASAAHQQASQLAPPEAPGLPAEVAALCLSCLSHDPADRPAAAEVAARLTAAGGGDVPATGQPANRGAAASAAHPPTLVDHSGSLGTLRSAASGGPGRAPAGQPVPGSRIAGSAAVPHRPAAPAFDSENHPAPRTGRPRRSRLAAVAVAGGIIAAGLALTLVAAAFRPGAGTSPGGSVAGGTSSASPSATTSPAEPAGPTARPLPSTDAGIVNEVDLILTEAVNQGHLGPDVAKDLRGEVDALRAQLGEGRRKDLRDKADSLRQKIDSYSQDQTIDQATADQLLLVLGPLLNGNGQHGNGQGANNA
jgi:serine/threonine-protein kinase